MQMGVGRPHVLEDHTLPARKTARASPHGTCRAGRFFASQNSRIVKLMATQFSAQREKRVDLVHGESGISVSLWRGAYLHIKRLRLRNRRVLVVGGGEIALQRVRKLLAAGAKVTLIAPNIKPEFEPLAESEQLRLVHRAFQRADVNGQYFLVIGATNHPPTQTALWEEAEKLGLLCNVVDDPQHCNYFTPAVVERGDLQIAISTAGESPAFAHRLKCEIETHLPQDLGPWLTEQGELRREVLASLPAGEERNLLLNSLAQRSLCGLPECPARRFAQARMKSEDIG